MGAPQRTEQMTNGVGTPFEAPHTGVPTLPLRPRPRRRIAEIDRRVVVTGIGVIAPSGFGVQALWDFLAAGRSATRLIEEFDVSDFPVKVAAQVPEFRPRDFISRPRARGLGRFCQLAIASTRLAVEDARTPEGLLTSERAGLYLGTAAGAIAVGEAQATSFMRRGVSAIRPLFAFAISPHTAAGQSANEVGIRGPIETVCSDCSSGLDAVALAQQQIASGFLDVALAGGADAPLTPLLFGSFGRTGLLAPEGNRPDAASRPFALDRSGFVLSEAGVFFVLEAEEIAVARGARIYGEILGSGTGRDRPTDVGDCDPTGHGYVVASSRAMESAGVERDEIDHVNAHASGVPSTDLAEAHALRTLFGEKVRNIAITSVKGGLGQPLAAGGALQLATSLLVLQRGEVPPTVNCEELDPACGFEPVRRSPLPLRARRALLTSRGFAGSTTSLVVGARS